MLFTGLIAISIKYLDVINKKTDYLICGTKPGSKAKKALELNITTISESEWITKINM